MYKHSWYYFKGFNCFICKKCGGSTSDPKFDNTLKTKCKETWDGDTGIIKYFHREPAGAAI